MAIRIERVYRNLERRVVKTFAWLPITCKDREDHRVIKETRWLETVYVVQQYHKSYYSHWTNIRFADEEEYARQLEIDREHLAGEREPHVFR